MLKTREANRYKLGPWSSGATTCRRRVGWINLFIDASIGLSLQWADAASLNDFGGSITLGRIWADWSGDDARKLGGGDKWEVSCGFDLSRLGTPPTVKY